jgi:DNA-directed RNA polymerase alpha subunit
MNPSVKIQSEKDKLLFTLSGVNVSYANAIRRTMLSDIPTVVFKTTPYAENKSNFLVNTTRHNNEILKQRLSCIPIHITDLSMPLKNYLLVVDVENQTDSVQYVTTRDFKIKNVLTNEFLKEKDNQKIFPPNVTTGMYIDFARLRPKISEQIPGEKLSFTCEFTISNAKDDAMFNVVSTCSYGYTEDTTAIEEELAKKVQQWKEKGIEDIEFEKKNWLLLDAKRIVVKDSFDFIIESVGVYENEVIVKKACAILIDKCKKTMEENENNLLSIKESETTMKNSYDILLINEDYTLGKVIEYALYALFYEGTKLLSFCGFKKMHPHDSQSLVRVAYKEATDIAVLRQHLFQALEKSMKIFETIEATF